MKAECRRRAAANRDKNLREIFDELSSAHRIDGHCVSYKDIRSSMYKRRLQQTTQPVIELFNNNNLKGINSCSRVLAHCMKEIERRKTKFLTINTLPDQVIVNTPYQQCYTFTFDGKSDGKILVENNDSNLLMVHILCDHL